MRKDVLATHRGRVPGGVGGFAGFFDAEFLTGYRHPLLVAATDGVGTKVAIAQALDRHDTIGQDLVAMVIDDIVVSGATPLFLTDYIACGKVVPERIAAIVSGISRACLAAGVAVVGGETAEHPGILGEDEYDVAAAATGVVEADEVLRPESVRTGDVVVALGSSGLHSNGYSLARHIIAENGLSLDQAVPGSTRSLGEELLEPTLVYTPLVLDLLERDRAGIRIFSHVTGGGIAQNLQRVLPKTAAVTLDRSRWSPPAIMRALTEWGGVNLTDVEDTWNMGIGFFAVVDHQSVDRVIDSSRQAGIDAFVAGEIVDADSLPDREGFLTGGKGVSGGFVRLVGDYADSSSSSSSTAHLS